jgi:MoaA/NifB/PqqE/SkfB family radical SAM enzyme
MSWMNTREAIRKTPHVLLSGNFFYDFDTVPLHANNLTWRKRINLVKCGFDTALKKTQVWSMPPIIQIEPTNLCNLSCPLCSVNSADPGRKKGMMSMETFNAILDELGDFLLTAILYNSGEPFINKNLPKMIAACTARNILTLTSTNGQYLQTLEEALEVVDAGLTAMIIAMDGSTQEIYQIYRKGGDIEKVKRCTALIEEAKIIRKSSFPYTNLRAVVMQQNQDDLPNIAKLANELGVNMVSYKTAGSTLFEDYVKYETTRKEFNRYEYVDGKRQEKDLIKCPYPFRQPSIFWDGTVAGCQRDYEKMEAFGKIGEQPFAQIWNGLKARELRRMIRFGTKRPTFCARCRSQNRIRENILSSVELRPVSD